MEETSQFCDALLGSAPEGMYSLVWTLKDKRSHWVSLADGTESVARVVRDASASSDVYVAVSLASKQGTPFSRISSDASAGIMGLWADIDIADPDVHKKWNLPPDEESARDLLGRAGMTPSLLVHSGHGLQAWWLFAEFWEFETEHERRAAADLAMAWNTTLRVRAAERGWTVDSTFDLARVMRVPGSMNLKGDVPVPVRLLEDTGVRYGRDDFDPFCVDDGVLKELGLSPARSYVVESGLVLNGEAWPPGDKLDAMIHADKTFSDSWNRKRRDLLDQSPSTYDMSLASLAVQANWTDQEIVDLIIGARRKHGDDLSKALRLDYVQRTISKARDTYARAHAAEAIEDVVEVLRTARASGDDEEVKVSRRAAMDAISQQLELEIVHFIKYTSDPPSYRMVTPTCGVDLGDAGGILSWSEFRESVVAATGRMIPRFKTNAWDRISQAVFDACEEQDVGQESTEEGMVNAWLTEYLSSRPPLESAEDAIASEYPFRDQAGVHLFTSSLRRWLWLGRGERVSQRELGRLMRQFGCVPIKVNAVVDGARSSRAAWTLPQSFDVPAGRSW